MLTHQAEREAKFAEPEELPPPPLALDEIGALRLAARFLCWRGAQLDPEAAAAAAAGEDVRPELAPGGCAWYGAGWLDADECAARAALHLMPSKLQWVQAEVVGAAPETRRGCVSVKYGRLWTGEAAGQEVSECLWFDAWGRLSRCVGRWELLRAWATLHPLGAGVELLMWSSRFVLADCRRDWAAQLRWYAYGSVL